MVPSKIGPYRVVRQLGEGGMGAVFEAVHEAIGRNVAIKVLLPEYARNTEFASRLFNEARAVNVVEHPGVVQISDCGQLPDGTAYLVMELLRGESLAQRLQRLDGRLPAVEVLPLGWQMADSLSAAHAKGIIHRDLKPENVMIVPDPHMPGGERTKLLDFGIAKVTESVGGLQVKTRRNAVMGTPSYMSPEQGAGAGGVDAQSDVYSLGVILYEMLSGRPPFVSESAGKLIAMHMFKPPEPLQNVAPEVPVPVAALVHRLLSKSKDERPTMKQLAKELAKLCKLFPRPAKPQTLSDEPSSNIDKVLSTAAAADLGGAAAPAGGAQRRRTGLLIGAGLAGAAVVVAGVMLLPAHKPEADPPQRPDAAQKRVNSVTLKIETEPPGADVIRVSDGQLLGKTPLEYPQEEPASQVKVRLHLPGYRDREVVLGLAAGNPRYEMLEPLPATSGAAIHPGHPKAAKSAVHKKRWRRKHGGR